MIGGLWWTYYKMKSTGETAWELPRGMENMWLHKLRKSLGVWGFGIMRFHAYHQKRSFENIQNFANERIARNWGFTAIAGVTFVEMDGLAKCI